MPDSLTTWRPGTRETWGQEEQPGLDRRPGPDRQGGPDRRAWPGPAGWFRTVVGSGRAGCPVGSGLAGRPGRLLAGSAVRDFGLLPRPGSAGGVLSGAPAGWSSVRDTAVGLRPVDFGGCPAAQRGGSQRGAPAFRRPESPGGPQPRASGAQGGTGGTEGGTSGAQGGTSGAQGGTSGAQGGTSGAQGATSRAQGATSAAQGVSSERGRPPGMTGLRRRRRPPGRCTRRRRPRRPEAAQGERSWPRS